MEPDSQPPEIDLAPLDGVRAAPALRAWVEAAVADAEAQRAGASRRGPRRWPRRRGPMSVGTSEAPLRRRRRLGAAGAFVVVALLAVVALTGLLGGDASAPDVRAVAPVALRQARAAAPVARGDGFLKAEIDGVSFPEWSNWTATGERSDRVDGRSVRTVFYANRGGDRIGYAIAGGDALPYEGGRYVRWRGIPMWVYELDGATAVMWMRDGRTCIVAGRGVGTDTLLALAGTDRRTA